MLTIILSLFSSSRQAFQTRAALQAEILALRHQLLGPPALPPWPSAALESRGSIPMGMALPILERLAIRPRHRPTRNGDRLAPPRIPSVLEVEEPPSARAARCVARGRQFDPQDESGQSSLGCASHPRATVSDLSVGHCASIFRMIFSAFAIEPAIQKSSAGHGRSICASLRAARMLAAMSSTRL